MKETARNANHESLLWLDYAPRWSREGKKTKLSELLECVRSEIVFEVELAAIERSGRRKTG